MTLYKLGGSKIDPILPDVFEDASKFIGIKAANISSIQFSKKVCVSKKNRNLVRKFGQI